MDRLVVVIVTGHSVVLTAVTEVLIEVEDAGQSLTVEPQEVIVTVFVEYSVDTETAGISSTMRTCTTGSAQRQ